MFLKRAVIIASSASVVGPNLYVGLAIYYWLPWPDWLRSYGSVLFPITMLALWFFPRRWPRLRRATAVACLGAMITAYTLKKPVEQPWVDLHAQKVSAVVDRDRVTLINFRDAIHSKGAPSIPRWTTRTLDLSTLQGAELIMQPFGDLKASTVNV